MAKYTVEITVDGNNINTVRRQMAAAFPGQEVRCDKIEFNKSRADRLGEAEGMVENAKSEVESLRDELQDWQNGLPENLQGGSKNDELNDAISELEAIVESLEQADFGSVSFPSMM